MRKVISHMPQMVIWNLVIMCLMVLGKILLRMMLQQQEISIGPIVDNQNTKMDHAMNLEDLS